MRQHEPYHAVGSWSCEARWGVRSRPWAISKRQSIVCDRLASNNTCYNRVFALSHNAMALCSR